MTAGPVRRPWRRGDQNVLYRVAKRLDITTDELKFDLDAIGFPHVSVVSSLSPQLQAEVEHYRAQVASGDITTPRPSFPTRAEQQAAAERAQEAKKQPVTTETAAEMLGIRPATLRQWVSRGHLQPVGRTGRQNLYQRADLHRVQAEVQARTQRVPGLKTAHVDSKHFEQLITAAAAAGIARVSPSTIRNWVLRGHLQPAGRDGRRHLYRVVDVLRAARRSPVRRTTT